MDRRQNNGSVKALSPRHCPANLFTAQLLFQLPRLGSHKDNFVLLLHMLLFFFFFFLFIFYFYFYFLACFIYIYSLVWFCLPGGLTPFISQDWGKRQYTITFLEVFLKILFYFCSRTVISYQKFTPQT